MGNTYFCEKYNPYNIHRVCPIVDETELILSPAYLHTFVDKILDEEFCVISDNIGIPMPHLRVDNEYVIGTSRCIYFIDVALKKVVHKLLLHSPCVELVLSKNKLIVICESDVVILSFVNKRIIGEFEFNDAITDYMLNEECLALHLMEGTEQMIEI